MTCVISSKVLRGVKCWLVLDLCLGCNNTIFTKYFVFWRQAICFESQTYWLALSAAAMGFRLPRKFAFTPVKPFGVKYALKSTLDYII